MSLLVNATGQRALQESFFQNKSDKIHIKRGNQTMALSYDEMQQLFEQLGFKGFSMRLYAEMEYLLSLEMEDNAKSYAIDVVPGGLEHGQNDGIALLEKHYYKDSNMACLVRKWLDIILHFSCYYPLETVFVTGLGLPDIEDFMEQTPNEEGYYLEFPMESIRDLDELSDLVFQKTFGHMTFWFPTLDMVFHVETGEVYIIVTLKKITEENQAAIVLLRKLVEAKGLFLV